MVDWIVKNIGTLLTALVLIVIVAAIVMQMFNDKKKGKSSCGCKCGNCPMNGSCHKKSN